MKLNIKGIIKTYCKFNKKHVVYLHEYFMKFNIIHTDICLCLFIDDKLLILAYDMNNAKMI